MQTLNEPINLVLTLCIHKQIFPITNNDNFDCPFPPSTHLLTVIDDINTSISPTYQAVQPSCIHSDVLWSDGWTLQNKSMCKVIQLTKKSLVMFSKISNLGWSWGSFALLIMRVSYIRIVEVQELGRQVFCCESRNEQKTTKHQEY